MQTTFNLEPYEFTSDFYKALKALVKNHRVKLIVETEMDETERILSNPVMAKILQERIANVEKGLVTEVNIDELLAK